MPIFALSLSSNPIRSAASVHGADHGACFCAEVPGKNPDPDPQLTVGRVHLNLCTMPALIAIAAYAIAVYVLPVPAAPFTAIRITLGSHNASIYFCICGVTLGSKPLLYLHALTPYSKCALISSNVLPCLIAFGSSSVNSVASMQ